MFRKSKLNLKHYLRKGFRRRFSLINIRRFNKNYYINSNILIKYGRKKGAKIIKYYYI